jgi:hypothetical protein
MSANLKTIAFLMLLAGLSLGIFASRAVRALGPGEPVASSHSTVEQQVEFYQRFYQLDPQQTDRIRQALLVYDRKVRDKLMEFRASQEQEFHALFEKAHQTILDVVADAERRSDR